MFLFMLFLDLPRRVLFYMFGVVDIGFISIQFNFYGIPQSDSNPVGQGGANFPPTEEAFDENGEPILEYITPQYSFLWNPYVELTDADLQHVITQIRTGVFVQLSPTPGIVLKSEFNPELSLVQENDFFSERTRLPRQVGGAGFVSTNFDQNYIWTNTASWTFNFGSRSEMTVLS